MKELSLNILDISMNSVKAGAKNIEISIEETDNVLKIVITDDCYRSSTGKCIWILPRECAIL